MKTFDILILILIAIIFYSYIGYGVILYFAVKLKQLFSSAPVKHLEELPTVTFLVAAWNEEACIEEKIKNTLQLDYPNEKLNIVFVTDGSTDYTPKIVSRYKEVNLMHLPVRRGKTAAINRAMRSVDSEIVIFSDANAMVNKQAVLEIVKHYANPSCGCVAGEKRIVMPDLSTAASAGEGLYWKYESKLKQWDAALYSATGAAGELFSIRTELFDLVEEDVILDDFMISMAIVEKGYTIAYEPRAFAVENSSDGVHEEIKRKIRICAGGFQAMSRLLSLLNLFRFGIFSWQYLSHRVLRWTLAPLALLLLIPLSIIGALTESDVYMVLFFAQVFFYFLALLGWEHEKLQSRKKLFYIPYYFLIMNYSVFAGFQRYITNNQSAVWQRAKRATV